MLPRSTVVVGIPALGLVAGGVLGSTRDVVVSGSLVVRGSVALVVASIVTSDTVFVVGTGSVSEVMGVTMNDTSVNISRINHSWTAIHVYMVTVITSSSVLMLPGSTVVVGIPVSGLVAGGVLGGEELVSVLVVISSRVVVGSTRGVVVSGSLLVRGSVAPVVASLVTSGTVFVVGTGPVSEVMGVTMNNTSVNISR